MADIKKEDVLAYLENANMLEISELIKDIEEKFGVTAAVPVAIAGGAAQAAGGDANAAEEKSEWNVVIQDHGAKKIDVIKAIRQVSSLGLKDAKEVAETAGSVVLEAVAKEAAEDAKAKLEEAGATVELQ